MHEEAGPPRLPPGTGVRLSLHAVKRALVLPLPGERAQLLMAVRPRSSAADFGHQGQPREGAVLIALYPRDGALWLPLTRRSARLAHHKGQISFPGGRRDPGDASLWQTAVREANEEIGIDPSTVERLGALSQLYISSSHFAVRPFVSWIPQAPDLCPNPAEVDGLIEMPLATLLDDDAKKEEIWVWRGRDTTVPYYSYDGHIIWGATAMMLSELEHLLRRAIAAEAAPGAGEDDASHL